MDSAVLAPDQVDAVVFDVIGTLVDEDGTWTRVAERLAVGAGLDETAGLYASWVERLERHMHAVVEGDAHWRPHRQLVSDSAREAITNAGGVPSPAAYRYAIEALRIDPARTLFVAAHPWDLRAASEHGFRTAYIARPGAERPTEEDQFDLAVEDLSALAGFLTATAGPR